MANFRRGDFRVFRNEKRGENSAVDYMHYLSNEIISESFTLYMDVEFSETTFLSKPWDPIHLEPEDSLADAVHRAIDQISEIDTIASNDLRHDVHLRNQDGVEILGFPVFVYRGSVTLASKDFN